MGPREQKDRKHGAERKLRNLGRDQAGAADECAVAIAHFGRGELAGRSTRHIDCAIAGCVDEDSCERACASVKRQMMPNPQAIHSLAQELAVAIVAELAENAGRKPENPAPSKMIEDQAADLGAFDRGARGMRSQQDFFVGADYSRGPIEQVDDHAPASDDIEFRFNHCG